MAEERLAHYPVVALTGARQSGKTTLARKLASHLPYVTLEDPDVRAFATEDPRGFLRQYRNGAVFDEIQRTPQLLSYLQGVVDEDRSPGRFLLTGSSQFELVEGLTQSLAGRCALLRLPTLSSRELLAGGLLPGTVDGVLQRGGYPPLHGRFPDPAVWLQDYVATYLERDVRQVLRVQDLAAFQRFVRLCAGRTGQLLNFSSLGADAGISRHTAVSWFSVLEASHLVFQVHPWFTNLSKRLIKSPKLYFTDVGLAAWLIGVRAPEHLPTHPLRGCLFENWVMTELLKAQLNQGRNPSLHFLRDKQGNEIDAWMETNPGEYAAVEIKSGETVASDFFQGIRHWRSALPGVKQRAWLVHGGEARQDRDVATVLPWRDLGPLLNEVGSI